MKAKIVLPGRPITKKNNQKIINNRHTARPQIIQSDRYRAYEEDCLKHLLTYRGPRFTGPIKLTARYWMPNKRSWPDLVGLIQATQDILQKAKIISDDKYVVSLDGSHIAGIDNGNPRTEIEIEDVSYSCRENLESSISMQKRNRKRCLVWRRHGNCEDRHMRRGVDGEIDIGPGSINTVGS
ncbi:MAG TPA: RusA family crossover junction endodeoxyribonuclease [Firmicutes bacterium]|nr:RusA family crossover junction endodeoxyribonuclease [Bacillota bacterium]